MEPQTDLSHHDGEEGPEKPVARRKTFIVLGGEGLALLIAQELANRSSTDGKDVVCIDLEAAGSATKIVISEEDNETLPELRSCPIFENMQPLPSSIVPTIYDEKRETLGSQVTPYAKQGRGSANHLRNLSRKKGK